MRRQWRVYLLALSFALGATSNVLGEAPTFTTIDFPGGTIDANRTVFHISE
jgi:hypothetical protein